MAQKSIKSSSGWRFQPKKPANQIVYTGSPTAMDSHTLNTLTEQVQNFDTEDLELFFKVLPPVEQLIQQIPFSLPLLEAIYLKCEMAHVENGKPFPLRALHCEQIFCQLVWWSAYCEQNNENSPPVRRIPTFKELEPCVATLVSVLTRNCPGLVERAHADRAQLNSCLESLGCHGLVNCSSGLIRMCDAVQLEVVRHGDRMKAVAARMKEITEMKHGRTGSLDPSTASHQRQMSLKLSEVFERLKLNETIEVALEEAISNNHLNSLLRIVRKRVASDRLLIGLFNAFTRAAPDDFSFEHLDPVVAKLILIFNNSYDKLLALCPLQECDSGCSADGSTEERRSSTGTGTSPDSPNSQGPKPRYRSKKSSHHSSLHDLAQQSETPLKGAHSLNQLRNTDSLAAGARIQSEEKLNDTDRMRRVSTDNHDDTMKLRLHISHLKSELKSAQRQISQMMTMQSRPGSAGLWPEPDYPEATSYYNCSSREDVDGLVQRFSDLFIRARSDIMQALDELPEFRNLQELQLKTVMSVIVLTYRSVVDSVNRRRERIWNVIDEGTSRVDNEDSASLDVSLYRHMYRRAKSQHGMNNAKEILRNHFVNDFQTEVTSQIWQTLFDFPSLKKCTPFNRFILECCDLSWDIVAGIDGRFPRLRIEFESAQFNHTLHLRVASSHADQADLHDDLRKRTLSPVNGQAISQVLWPGLIDTGTGKCLLKALVATD